MTSVAELHTKIDGMDVRLLKIEAAMCHATPSEVPPSSPPAAAVPEHDFPFPAPGDPMPSASAADISVPSSTVLAEIPAPSDILVPVEPPSRPRRTKRKAGRRQL